MEGIGKTGNRILVLGATNLPWELDPAVRRRFERRIYIPLPEYESRLLLFKKLCSKTPNTLSDE
jgi:vacuolar protein-sorting-associated protein 4